MERESTSIRFIIVVLALSLFVFALQYFLIYKALIVPRLPSVKSVPLIWWAGYMLPVLLVLLAAGFWSKKIEEIYILSLCMAILYKLFVYFLAKFNMSGFLKAYEGSFFNNFVAGTFRIFIIFLFMLLIGYGLRKAFLGLSRARRIEQGETQSSTNT